MQALKAPKSKLSTSPSGSWSGPFPTRSKRTQPGSTEFPSPESKLHIPSLFYLGLILLVIGLTTSLIARWIGRRFDVQRTLAQ